MAAKQAALDVFRAVNTAFEDERGQPDHRKDQRPFIASEWKGGKAGYVFHRGPAGLGYYLDQAGTDAAAEKGEDEAVPSHRDANELLEVCSWLSLAWLDVS
jgi:hypothetical protein